MLKNYSFYAGLSGGFATYKYTLINTNLNRVKQELYKIFEIEYQKYENISKNDIECYAIPLKESKNTSIKYLNKNIFYIY